MSKIKQKNPSYDTSLIDILHERHGVTKDYIRKSIRGIRTGVIPIRISEEYKKMVSAKKIAENKAVRSLDNYPK